MTEEPQTDRLSRSALEQLFKRQKEHAAKVAVSTYRERKAKLKRMLEYLSRSAQEIEQATYADLRKPAAEARVSEMLTLTTELRYHIRNLKRWMQPQQVATPMLSIGTSSYIQYEPKGVTLIVSPWNYPISLALKPLISAISAGCTAIIKPSEFTPHSAEFVKTLVRNLFNPEEVSVVEGGKEVASDLLAMPFDHIFFTGSPAVGKVVMKAAAEHLTSVSLELGGKSPSIVDKTADLKTAAQQIVWAKFLNNGQTCIAPDYVLVDQTVRTELLAEIRTAIQNLYQTDQRDLQKSADYGRIVNRRHFARLRTLFQTTIDRGATLVLGGAFDEPDLFIAPTVLTDVTFSMPLMQEEIFGPILPVMSFATLGEAVKAIQKSEKPLALYIHSKSAANADYILKHTSSGNALVNEMLTQFQHPEIPFGGIGNSGMGKANGFFGFQEFSNAKGVIKRQFGTLKFIYPPFTGAKEKLIRLVLKYL